MSKENLFKRLKKNAANMEAKGFIDNAYLDARNADIEKLIREAAGYDQLRVDWYKKMLRDGSGRLLEMQDPKIRINDKGLENVTKDKKVKATYNVGESSNGYQERRNKNENNLFGTKNTVSGRKKNPNKNPIYGYAADATPHGFMDIDIFGDNIIHLKPTVKNRMTYSIGDSLRDGVAGRYGFSDWSAFVSPKDAKYKFKGRSRDEKLDYLFEQIRGLDKLSKSNKDSKLEDYIDYIPYIENQYHGGINADDIESVSK